MTVNESVLLDLLHRARSGDFAAREQLFEKCRAYVEVIARANVASWLRTKVDASDLVQQTMLEAHRGFDQFEGESEGEWLAWLRRILQHNSADFVRRYGMTAKRRIGREMSLHGAADSQSPRCDPCDGGETPSQFVMRQEDAVLVAEAIAQLSEDHQEVILLRNVQRLPFDEVARRMNRTRPAAQMLWMRALKRLEDILKSCREST